MREKKYYILWNRLDDEEYPGTHLTSYNRIPMPVSLDTAQYILKGFTGSHNRYFLVDEFLYERFWRDYLS